MKVGFSLVNPSAYKPIGSSSSDLALIKLRSFLIRVGIFAIPFPIAFAVLIVGEALTKLLIKFEIQHNF